ncbi:MAG: hypothetical protein HYZ42_02855 [Bacteroidetes bacterium]|nr:hypothetical protein [Bacteroidota bacterium]
MQDIIKKFKFRDKGIIINAPKVIEKEFITLGFKSDFDKTRSTNTVIFINDSKELLGFLNTGLKNIEIDSVLWLAYPKGTYKIKTDINRDTIREKAEEFGITTVTAISIDDTWSALRFRPIEKVGK